MGIRGLLSYVEACPEACKEVSIAKLATDHKRSLDCTPVLVVDGSNLIPWLYNYGKENLESIYGGQWIQFKQILEELVLKFQSKGIKLVFMFYGTISEEKQKEWAKRRMNKYKEISSIFNDISHNRQSEVIGCRITSPALKLLAKFILKELDVEMYQTDKDVDADNYIANYANENRAVFGILSSDSEFIILDTKPLLSVSKLSLNNLKTLRYDRFSFAERYLNLSTNQLPLFACLMGNGYVSADDLTQFHRRVVKGEKPFKKAKVGNLCNLIKQKKWTGQFDDKREMNEISREVFGHDSNLIKRGLESYAINKGELSLSFCISMSPKFEQSVHQRHFNCSNVCIYNLLCKKEYGSSEVLEDESRTPSALIYREIRQRCYGVLFNCSVNPDKLKSTVIEERCWYRRNGIENNLNIPEAVHPLPLRNTSEIINIEDLWFKYSDTRRFEIFWHILQIPMEFKLLTELPEDQVALACILNYLIARKESGPLLEPLDVAVFVAQALWKTSSLAIKLLENPPVDPRAVNLSTLFVNGIEPVLMALETCGFPTPYKYAMPWKFFDGKLFHFLYNAAKKCPRVQVLCNTQVEAMKKFYQLLPVVTDQTEYHPEKFEWKNVLEDFNSQQNAKS